MIWVEGRDQKEMSQQSGQKSRSAMNGSFVSRLNTIVEK